MLKTCQILSLYVIHNHFFSFSMLLLALNKRCDHRQMVIPRVQPCKFPSWTSINSLTKMMPKKHRNKNKFQRGLSKIISGTPTKLFTPSEMYKLSIYLGASSTFSAHYVGKPHILSTHCFVALIKPQDFFPAPGTVFFSCNEKVPTRILNVSLSWRSLDEATFVFVWKSGV